MMAAVEALGRAAVAVGRKAAGLPALIPPPVVRSGGTGYNPSARVRRPGWKQRPGARTASRSLPLSSPSHTAPIGFSRPAPYPAGMAAKENPPDRSARWKAVAAELFGHGVP